MSGPNYPNSYFTLAPYGSGIASGYTIQPYDILWPYYELSGVEQIIGLNPLNGWPSITARISGIESGYLNLSSVNFVKTLNGLFGSVLLSGFGSVIVSQVGNTVFVSGVPSAGTTYGFSGPNNSGILSSGDWSTFNNKQGLLTVVSPLGLNANTLSGNFASATDSGFLSRTDWNNFNNKSNITLNSGNLTTSTPGVTITGGTNSIIGAGTTVNIQQADASHSGLLGSGDWATFNNKQNTITTVGPLSLSAGLLTGTFAGASNSGFLSSADWNTFNNKISASSLTGYYNKTGDTITGNTIITSGNGVIFNSGTVNPLWQEGKVFYDASQKTLAYYNDDPNVTLNIGQEDWIRVYNNTNITLLNGQAVYITGSFNGLPTVNLAQANNSNTAKVVGVLTDNVSSSGIGYVTAFGVVHTINTSGMTAGATTYLSATIAGGLTGVKPSDPNMSVQLGVPIVIDSAVGSFLVQFGGIGAGLGAANTLRGVNAAGTAEEYKQLLAGANVTITSGIGSYTISAAAASVSGLNIVAQKFAETPSGLINNVNQTYTLLNPPINNSLQLYFNGNLLNQSGIGLNIFDYTLSSSTISMLYAPPSGSSLIATYQYTSASGYGVNAGINKPNATTSGALALWSATDGSLLANSSLLSDGNNLTPTNSGVSNLGTQSNPFLTGYFKSVVISGNPIGQGLLYSTAISGLSSLSISGLNPGTRYQVKYNLLWNTSAGLLTLRFNGDAGANYDYVTWGQTNGTTIANHGTGSNFGYISNDGSFTITAGTSAIGELEFATSPAINTIATVEGKIGYRASATQQAIVAHSNQYSGVSPVTRFDLVAAVGGTFTGQVLLYSLG